ncbi:MAG: hypothetical protein CVU03_03465 [Bacteroidetes bacterium HGW-Bacteroidetes-2]|jgi:hypothetical protein|nr:MAG: hypothetical protein CVU03_03465 [Bacteroidetes bacterium HGW-Bacteroidetes-2]
MGRLKPLPATHRIHFQDQGQDCLWWEVDKNGKVINANLQARIWCGCKVPLYIIEAGQPGDQMDFWNALGEERVFKYPITKIETL